MANPMEEQVRSALIAFVDFLYAIVFGLVLAEAFEQIIIPGTKSTVEIASNLLLVLGVFYFLTWDWLHGRLLTLRNPYKGYRRFFVETMIAFSGYGAALNATRAKVSFVIYVALILVLGAYWARRTLREYPDSRDRDELLFIQIYQTITAAAVCVGTTIWYFVVSHNLTLRESIIFVIFGWLFVLSYEILMERPIGIMWGPGVPFLGKRQLDKVRSMLRKYHGAKKGG